jgi:hypothetical protein
VLLSVTAQHVDGRARAESETRLVTRAHSHSRHVLALLFAFARCCSPLRAGFDEQRLRANETVDMPVFFYIDPAMETDPRTNDIKDLTLSYTFFPVEDDEDDTRTEAEKDAAMDGVRTHLNSQLPTNAPLSVKDAMRKAEAEVAAARQAHTAK